jgi:MFS family permease
VASGLRRFCRGVAANGALWAIGSGLASGTVVNYLAMDYGAAGLALSFAIAAPKLTSLVQLVQPWFVGRIASRKTICLASLLVSSLVLATLPLTVEIAAGEGDFAALVALIGGWALYHLLEYVGAAALWSWMRDEVPGRIRGRVWGARESWMAAGRWIGLFAGVGLAEAARQDWTFLGDSSWIASAMHDSTFLGRHLLLAIGGGILCASVVPLFSLRDRRSAAEPFPASQYAAAFRSSAFWKLIAFATLLAAANGFAQAPQGLFPYRVLGLTLTTMLVLRGVLFAGQGAIATWFGKRFDQGRHRRWMLICQLIVAAGGALFLFATPEFPWPFHAAWVMWIAYAGLNVAIPDLTLRFAPQGAAGPWIGLSFSLAAVTFGVATVAGGWAFDHLLIANWLGLGDSARGQYDAFFLFATALRLLAAGCLFLLPGSLAKETRLTDERPA